MAETPKKRSKQTPKHQQHDSSSSNAIAIPATPLALGPTPVRRSSRHLTTPATTTAPPHPPPRSTLVSSRRKSLNFTTITTKTPKKSASRNQADAAAKQISPISPERYETRRKRKLSEEKNEGPVKNKALKGGKKRVYYRKVVYDGGEFSTGDDVYVKRREDAESDNEDPEVEECVMCFKTGTAVMIECDECLGGFHLKCLKPPLKEVPEGDWICGFCEAKMLGKNVELPVPPAWKKRARTAKEKLLSSDLWAAHIERFGNTLFLPMLRFDDYASTG